MMSTFLEWTKIEPTQLDMIDFILDGELNLEKKMSEMIELMDNLG